MSEKTKVDPELLKVMTTEFRVSHPHVFKPSQMMVNGQPKGAPNYSIEMLFDKETTDFSHIQAPVIVAIKAKWGPDKSKWPKLKMPFRDGDKPHGKKREVKEEHKGMWIVRASSLGEYQPPHVVARKPGVALTEAEFYPGCYARAYLKAHAYSFGDGSEGVKFVLDGVQKIRDGKAFGGRKPADQMFGVIEGDDGSEELNFDNDNFGSQSEDDNEMTF